MLFGDSLYTNKKPTDAEAQVGFRVRAPVEVREPFKGPPKNTVREDNPNMKDSGMAVNGLFLRGGKVVMPAALAGIHVLVPLLGAGKDACLVRSLKDPLGRAVALVSLDSPTNDPCRCSCHASRWGLFAALMLDTHQLASLEFKRHGTIKAVLSDFQDARYRPLHHLVDHQ